MHFIYHIYIILHIYICIFQTFTNIPHLYISRGLGFSTTYSRYIKTIYIFLKDFQQHTPSISRPYITAQGGVLEPILVVNISGHIGLYTVLSYSTALICIVLYWTYYWPNMERYIIKPCTGPLLHHTSTHIPYYGMHPQEYYYSVLIHYRSPTSTVSYYTIAL